MKIENIIFNCTVKIPVEVQSLKCTAILQVFTSLNKPEEVEKDGKYYVDMDIIEYENIIFMGLPVVNDYKCISKLRQHLSDFGVNLDRLIDDEINKAYSKERMLEMLMPQLITLE